MEAASLLLHANITGMVDNETGIYSNYTNSTLHGLGDEDGAAFAIIFCCVFVIMLLIIFILICKVCSLRRSIVPDVYRFDAEKNSDGLRRF